MDRMKMGNFLSELRKEKDLSQADLAEIIGVTFQAVSKWERGEAIPDISILEKLASFYEVSIDEIIKGERLLKKEKIKVVQEEPVQKENGFLKQKRIFGFWYSIAYFVLFILIGFCPFARAELYSSYTTTYFTVNYYQLVFSSNFNIGNFFLLIQFLTTLGIISLTLLFYVCTTKKSFRAMYITRFVFIIINLLTLIMNISLIANASVGCYLMFILILAVDILYLCLKPNRKSYILKDYE